MKRVYKNRQEAGRTLAEELSGYKDQPGLLVLALPRGGVELAAEVASALNAAIDIIVVRKMGIPGLEEVAMGAIASGGVEVLNKDILPEFDIAQDAVEKVRQDETKELYRRERAYRGDRPIYDVRDRDVIIVDDGIATGATIQAAVRSLKGRQPRRMVIAVPVAPSAALRDLREMVDEVVCPLVPENFQAVGQWYESFPQTTDDEVRRILSGAWDTNMVKNQTTAKNN